MAQRWLRGPYPQLSGVNYHQSSRGGSILLYFFFRYLMGYTYVEENVAGAFSYNGSEDASGVDGQLFATNFRFTSAGATFTAGDVGKFLVILDSTNAVNCGIYAITNFVDANNVDIDFYSPDFPTAAGPGLSWWLVDTTSGAALTDGDNVVFSVNHAIAPWQFKMELIPHLGNGYGQVDFQVAPELGSWNTVTHTWNTNAKVLYRSYGTPDYGVGFCLGRGYIGGDTAGRIYAYGDTDGNCLFLMDHLFAGTGVKVFAFMGVLDTMFETSPARLAVEKVFAHGGSVFRDGGNTARTGDVNAGHDVGYGWNATTRDSQYLQRWGGWWDHLQDYFLRAITQPNHRHGSEYDGLGIWVVQDADVSYDPVWALLGQLPKDHMWLGAVAGIGDLTPFGSELFMHWIEGLVTPWPGVRWQ